jgi:hypothetical protein
MAKVKKRKIKKSTYIKISLLILILIGVFGIIISAVYKIQDEKTSITTNDEVHLNTQAAQGMENVSNWNVYNNSDYSIKYPKDYSFMEEDVAKLNDSLEDIKYLSSVSMDFPVQFKYIGGDKKEYIITPYLNIRTQETSSTLNDFILNSDCQEIRENPNSYQPYFINNNSALIIESPNCGPYGSTQIFTVKDGVGYNIYIDNYDKRKLLEPYFEEILSTFKFKD